MLRPNDLSDNGRRSRRSLIITFFIVFRLRRKINMAQYLGMLAKEFGYGFGAIALERVLMGALPGGGCPPLLKVTWHCFFAVDQLQLVPSSG